MIQGVLQVGMSGHIFPFREIHGGAFNFWVISRYVLS